MESNNDNELEGFLSDSEPEEEEEEVVDTPDEPDTPEEESKEVEGDEEETVEEIEALTPRETELIAQFTESTPSEDDSFDPSIPPKAEWATQEYLFIKEGESIDDILADPNKFNAKMAELYNDALRKGAELALEATYRGLPRTVSTYAKQQIETMNTVNDFYQQNKDLIPFKPAFARVAQKIGTEHPEYTVSQLLTESGKAARKIFKLQGVVQEKSKKSSPAFVTQKGGTNRVSSNSKKVKTIEDEVMELIL